MIRLQKITSAIATGVLLLNSFAIPTFAATIDITGNGSSSENEVKLETKQETTVVQNNEAKIENDINAESETGNNDANDNTGGDVTIKTGDATTTVGVANQANLNAANVKGCGTCNGTTDITVFGNGSNSKNEVELEKENKTSVYQDNKADIKNDINAESETGNNEVNRNTGGAVSITSGNAKTDTTVKTQTNANVANIGGNGNANTAGTISAQIIGNGSDSENEIKLDLDRSVVLVQNNEAKIENDINAESETGDNDANDNTGGDVTIKTGDATTTVGVDNMANFNAADVDCCLTDLSAKISGNGSGSENEIKAELENELNVFQENCGHDRIGNTVENLNKERKECELENKVRAESETGDNDANRNTGPTNDAVNVSTGNALDGVTISNIANANLFNQGATHEILGGFDFSFDLGPLFSFLHMS